MPIQAVFSPMIQGNARGGTLASVPINSLDMPKIKTISQGHDRDSSMVVHMEERESQEANAIDQEDDMEPTDQI